MGAGQGSKGTLRELDDVRRDPPRLVAGEQLRRRARHSRRGRVLHLHPAVGAAGAVGRAEALRHDALAAEREDVLEDDRAIAAVVLVERDPVVGMVKSFARTPLRSSIGPTALTNVPRSGSLTLNKH